MTKESLLHQAERAEALAAQTIDEEVKQALLKAARVYREQLKVEESEVNSERKLPKDIS